MIKNEFVPYTVELTNREDTKVILRYTVGEIVDVDLFTLDTWFYKMNARGVLPSMTDNYFSYPEVIGQSQNYKDMTPEQYNRERYRFWAKNWDTMLGTWGIYPYRKEQIWPAQFSNQDHAILIPCTAWLLWCWAYKHVKIRGVDTPRPWYMMSKPDTGRPVFAFMCPICHQPFTPPKSYITQEAQYESYLRWSIRHGREYHQWKLKSMPRKETGVNNAAIVMEANPSTLPEKSDIQEPMPRQDVPIKDRLDHIQEGAFGAYVYVDTYETPALEIMEHVYSKFTHATGAISESGLLYLADKRAKREFAVKIASAVKRYCKAANIQYRLKVVDKSK